MKLMLQVLIAASLTGTASVFAQNAVSSSSPPVAPPGVQASSGYARSADAYGTLLGALRGGGSNSVFVVPAQEMTIEDLLAANEDMTVMTRIFSRALEQANLGRWPDNPYVPMLGQSGQSSPTVYLGGYGALFTLSVDFPLAPGSKDEQPKPDESQAQVDPLWQEMRSDLYEPQPAQRGAPRQQNAPQYDPRQVETLKTTLIAALKHAANIRALAPDEVVVVTVVGARQEGDVHSIRSVSGSDSFEIRDGQGRRGQVDAARLADVTFTAPTVLMIRAGASAIQSFAKNQMSLEQFRQQVRILEYPHLGQMRSSNSGRFLPSISYTGR